MSITLTEALGQVDLEPGRTYRCRVNGRTIEVRVVEEIPSALMPAPLDESDIMLDPWFVLPPPTGGVIVRATPGKLPPPDLLEIPAEDEET